tara:strand:- start:448 stop:774 length:327 start_codon:yes stop_codon:yes gene_type:complete
MVMLVVVVVKVVVIQVVAVVVVVVELLVIVVVAAVPTTAAVVATTVVHIHVAMVVAMAKPFNPDHRETQNTLIYFCNKVKVHVTVNKNTVHNIQYERVSLGSTQIVKF